MSKKWKIDDLKEEYLNYPEKALGKKLDNLLNWAIDNDYFLSTTANYPCFGLRGKVNGTKKEARILSFQSDGKICAWLLPDRYLGGAAERDTLAKKLIEIYLLPTNWEAKEVNGTRDLTKNLRDFSDEELNKLKSIYSKYCF